MDLGSVEHELLLSLDRKVNSLCADVAVLKARLVGNGSAGLVQKVDDIDVRLDVLERYRSYQKGLFSVGVFLVGASAAISVIIGLAKLAGIMN